MFNIFGSIFCLIFLTISYFYIKKPLNKNQLFPLNFIYICFYIYTFFVFIVSLETVLLK